MLWSSSWTFYLRRAAQRTGNGHNTLKEGDATDARDGQRAYKEERFADAVRLLARAAQAAPRDFPLQLMLARACERMGWKDLAWSLFQRVEALAPDPELQSLAQQGRAATGRAGSGFEFQLVSAEVLDPVWIARARSEAPDGETALSWLVRHDACSFDRIVATLLRATPLPPSRPLQDRLGMRLLGDRQIRQGELKQALAMQAERARPLGSILVERFGLSESALQAALRAQTPLQATLGPQDAPAALLVRWGALKREDWESASLLGPKAFEVLVANGQLLPANVRRADAFRKAKLRLLAEGRFRLGEILVERMTIDRETLGKVLAGQVDQSYRLGELLIRRRLASAEAVLEGLIDQARRYESAAESGLPPLEFPPPPAPKLDEPKKPKRRSLIWFGLAGVSLLGALVFAGRYTRGDFAWLSAFNLPAERLASRERAAAELLGGSQFSGPRRERATAFDPLDLPQSELSSQPIGTPLGGAMTGAPLAGGFIGDASAEGFLGAPMAEALPEEGFQAPLAPEPVGAGEAAQSVGSSGVKDSVAYDPQRRMGARRTQTSRDAELQALAAVQYPIQEGRHLAEQPADRIGGRIQDPTQRESQLQAPIGLGRTLEGRPAESIQVRRDTAVFRLRLGRSLYERKDAASAREEFLSAIGLDPTLSPPHYYLGRIAEDRGDREVAAKWYRSYLARASGGEHADEVQDRLKRLAN